jgi:hypothetical protein
MAVQAQTEALRPLLALAFDRLHSQHNQPFDFTDISRKNRGEFAKRFKTFFLEIKSIVQFS